MFIATWQRRGPFHPLFGRRDEAKDATATCERLKTMGVKILRDAGPMTFASGDTRRT